MKALVTGGAGFIGSHLVDRLLELGHEVVVLDDFSTGLRENLEVSAGRIRLIEGDLRDSAAVADAVAGCDVVFHQAALASVARSIEQPLLVHEVNVGGTLSLLVQARDAGVRRIVFASSSSVYGDTPVLPKVETMPLSPRSPYAASKLAGEAFVAAFHAAYGLEGVALRYFNVYGPRQSPRSLYAAVVPIFAQAALEKRSPTIYGDGHQTRDFTFVGDVVEANLKAATTTTLPPGPVNVGGGGRISILELYRTIAQQAGSPRAPKHAPVRPGDVRDSLAALDRAREFLGWKPSTSLPDGIRRVLSSPMVAPSDRSSSARGEVKTR